MGRHRLKWDLRHRRGVLSVALIFCCFLYLWMYQNYEGAKLDTEIKGILQDTPYLWRRTRENMSSEDTVTSRINDQRMWISRISKTEFIRNSPPKRIYVRDGLKLYYDTKGRLICPYAPEFTDKCQLIKETFGYRLLGGFKYIGVDAETVIRNWGKRYTSQIPSGVVQIMHVMEPPIVARSVEPGVNNAILADFSRFSDIPIPYSQWIPNSDETEVPFEIPLNRTKMVVAMISNCASLDRLNYVKELQNYISVDVYGKCGKFNCSRTSWSKHTDCLKMIGNTYKFYLAFENSNCEDYITEKFFTNALKNNLLPIVMGAHPQDYKAAAPPGSFIHVNDFKTAEDLAKYLYKLNEDDEMYKAYFKWKRRGGSILPSGLEDFFCRVCGLLFYGDFVPRPIWNINAGEVLKCLPPGVIQWQ